MDFGPEVTSSDKSIKVLLNAQDKVSPADMAGSLSGALRGTGGRLSRGWLGTAESGGFSCDGRRVEMEQQSLWAQPDLYDQHHPCGQS